MNTFSRGIAAIHHLWFFTFTKLTSSSMANMAISSSRLL
jgi:hypothetical protein